MLPTRDLVLPAPIVQNQQCKQWDLMTEATGERRLLSFDETDFKGSVLRCFLKLFNEKDLEFVSKAAVLRLYERLFLSFGA